MLVGGNFTYRIDERFSFGGTANMDYISEQGLQIDAPGSIRGALSPNQQAATEFFGGVQSESYFRDFSFNTNANIRYTDFLDADKKHRLSAGLFTEYFYRNLQNAGFTAFGLNPAFPGSSSGFVDPLTPVIDADGNETFPFVPGVFSAEAETALLSYFGNATWDYDGRFGAEVTIRRDGTSRFQSDFRWGTFYSVAGRWNIDRESFMNNVEWVTALKTRISYGQTGNQSIGGSTNFFPGFQTISGGTGYQNNNILLAGNLADTSVQWETTTQLNFGIDFGLWKNRLTGSLDVYDKLTEDLFFGRNLSTAGTGFTNTQTNVGSMSNKGVEVQLAYDILRRTATNDWNINVFFNGAMNENRIENLDNDSGFVEGASRTRLQEGERAFTYFMQRWAGVNPADGRALYYTADGELTTFYNRAANGVYTGKQFDPVWTGGFGLNVAYKEWSLNSLWSFQYDAWRVNGTYALTEDVAVAGFSNVNRSMLNAWQQPGDITGIPALAFGGLRFQDGTRYLEDASFLRLRNINLAYNVKSETLDRIGFINGLRIFVQGTNLLTFSKWRGFDPETSRLNEFFSYPVPVQLTAGLDVTF